MIIILTGNQTLHQTRGDSVLHYRLGKALTAQMEATPPAPHTQRLIVGLVAAIDSPNADMQRALTEREVAIVTRAETLVARAVATGEPWIAQLGTAQPPHETIWRESVRTIAAYRDRWGITDPNPVGRIDDLNHQRRADHARATTALKRALVAASLVVDDTADSEERAAQLLTQLLPVELADKVISAEAFSALARTIKRAAVASVDLELTIAAATELTGARDYAAVLNYRLGRTIADQIEENRQRGLNAIAPNSPAGDPWGSPDRSINLPLNF